MYIRNFIILFLASALCLCSCKELKTKKGTIIGSVGTSRGGKGFHYFLGVPYAKPPVGNLRLKNPVGHGGWEGILDATKRAPYCLQQNWYDQRYMNVSKGKEDCLYLNIYTPNLEAGKKVPVMVYIHGGGFRCGTVGPINAPQYFMDEGVVIVTVQYRLGSLGFLSTEDSVIPGNFGLKDQAMALRWIKDNIDDYGGDPKCIVAFGENAGGASVHYLLTSPLSRDILKGGISQGGVIDTLWAFAPPGQSKIQATQLASRLGCGGSSVLECLQSLPAEKLVDAERQFIKWDIDPLVVFRPVIEGSDEGAFMTVDPRSVKVTLPWIAGLNSGEGNIRSAGLINQDDWVLDYFINNVNEVLSAMLYVDPKSPGIEKFLESVKKRYFSNLTDRKKVLKGHEKLFYDVQVAYPLARALERHGGRKYGYLFSYRAKHSLVDLRGPHKLNSSKPSHADELISLFDLSSNFGGQVKHKDNEFSKRIVKLWADFAKSLRSNNAVFDKKWKKFSKNKMLLLKTGKWKMDKISLEKIIKFWTEAFGQLQS